MMIGTSLSTTIAYCAGRSYGVHLRSALCADIGDDASNNTTISATVVMHDGREHMAEAPLGRTARARSPPGGSPYAKSLGTIPRTAQRDVAVRSNHGSRCACRPRAASARRECGG